jgi:hypothetical protein
MGKMKDLYMELVQEERIKEEVNKMNAEEILNKISEVDREKLTENADIKSKELIADAEKIVTEYTGKEPINFTKEDRKLVSSIGLYYYSKIVQELPFGDENLPSYFHTIKVFWDRIKENLENYWVQL